MDIGLSLTMKTHATSTGGGEATPWYLEGGVDPSNCVAAYQAKGAASYAASKVNLANPGTYDLVKHSSSLGETTWDASYGWLNVAVDTVSTGVALDTGIYANRGTFSMILRYSQTTNPGREIVGMTFYDADSYVGTALEIRSPGVGNKLLAVNGSTEFLSSSAAPLSGVIAIAGTKAYLDGIDLGANLSTWDSVSNGITLAIGGINYEEPGWTTALVTYGLKTQACAFYDAILTAEQVAAITTAMQAI